MCWDIAEEDSLEISATWERTEDGYVEFESLCVNIADVDTTCSGEEQSVTVTC